MGLIVGVTDGVGCGVEDIGGQSPVGLIKTPDGYMTLSSSAQIEIVTKGPTFCERLLLKQSV